MKNKEKIPSSFSMWLSPVCNIPLKYINLFDNAKMSIWGVQKACSLMDRAFVSLTNRCGFETSSESPVTPALIPKSPLDNNGNKKENPSKSLMDRASLTIDNLFSINLYLNVSNGGFLFQSQNER